MTVRHFHSDESDEYFFEEGCFILERLNDPTDPEASIARARVAPDGTTRFHYLIDTTERYLILSGHGRAWLGDAPAIAVVPGDVLLIPAGVRQRIRNDGAEDLVFLAICTPRFRLENYRDG